MGAGLADVATTRSRGGIADDGTNSRRAARHCGARIEVGRRPGRLSSGPLGGMTPVSTTSEPVWLDFSGAPPILIPRSLSASWGGTNDPSTGEYRPFNPETPVTDYDRVCAAAWPGKGIIGFMGSSVLALYTEFDLHTWDDRRQLVASGGWLPSDDELSRAEWKKPIRWRADHTEFLLMNSASDGDSAFPDKDYAPVVLALGMYTVQYCYLEGHHIGCFHRFVRDTHAA